jgi:hypothetical protein
MHVMKVLYLDIFVNNNVVDVQPETKSFCLKEIVRDGSCKDRGVYFCYDEFNAIGSWTIAKDCECQQLP